MTDNTEALPPLPEPQTIITDADVGSRAYTAWQMRDYARAALTAAPSAQAEPVAKAKCGNCDGKGYVDSWTQDGEYNPTHCEDCAAPPSAQAEPVAFTSQHQIEELRARKAGFAGRPDYLYAHAEPGGIYTVPLYAAPPSAQAEPQAPINDGLVSVAISVRDVHPESFTRGIRFAEDFHGIGKQESK